MSIKEEQDEKIRNKHKAIEQWHIEKKKLSELWIKKEAIQRRKPISQKAVMLCDLGENLGSEQNKKRPVLVISNNNFNKTGIVTIAPLSSRIKTKVNKKGKVVPSFSTHYVLKKDNYNFLVMIALFSVIIFVL